MRLQYEFGTFEPGKAMGVFIKRAAAWAIGWLIATLILFVPLFVAYVIWANGLRQLSVFFMPGIAMHFAIGTPLEFIRVSDVTLYVFASAASYSSPLIILWYLLLKQGAE